MTTTRITAPDGKQYDVTFTLTPATLTPAVLHPATLIPAVLQQATMDPATIQPESLIISSVVPVPPVGKIENFTATNGATFKVDGLTAANNTCNKSWSLNKIDDYTLRFEVRQGDVWSAASGSYTDSGCNRCEVDFMNHLMNEGAMTGWEGTITVLSGPASQAGFYTLVQSHATTNVSPTYCPFSIGLEENTGKLLIVLQEPNNGWNPVYRAPSKVVLGQPMRLKARVKMGPTGNGYVGVWWDDQQIVNFNGKVGAANSQYYWKYGPYRSQVSEVMRVDYKDVHITTG